MNCSLNLYTSIVPHPTTGGAGFHDCPEVPYYQADLIQNKSDSQALAVAAEDAVQCAFNGDETKIAQATVHGADRRHASHCLSAIRKPNMPTAILKRP